MHFFFEGRGGGAQKPPPFLVINDVIMTSLLLLKIICLLANFVYFIRDLTIYVFIALSTFSEMWILLINWTTWRHNDVRLRHIVSQVIPRRWMSTLPIVCNFGGRRLSGFQVMESRKPKKPSLNKVKTWYNTKLFNIIRLFLLAKLKCYLFLLI